MRASKRARRHLKLAEVIEDRPEHLAMGSWFWIADNDDYYGGSSAANMRELIDLLDQREGESLVDKVDHICNSTACVAGWAALLWGPKVVKRRSDEPWLSIRTTAAVALGYWSIDEHGHTRIEHDLKDLFDGQAPWQTAEEVAEELRRRAAAILEEDRCT